MGHRSPGWKTHLSFGAPETSALSALVVVRPPLQPDGMWARLGYTVSVMDATRDGTPRGWSAKGAVGCVRFRRVKNGVMVKRANGAQNLSVNRLVPRQTPPDPGLALDGRG